MKKLFLSFSSQDISQARFMVRLLNFHRFDAYIGQTTDPELRKHINVSEHALLRCEKVILIVTKNTLNSTRVKKELTWFQVLKPDIEIITCLFDDIHLNGTIPKQMSNVFIDFQDLTHGFTKLFERLNVKFLNPVKNVPKQKEPEDRRLKGDRRSSNLTNRLYISLWKRYVRTNQRSDDAMIRLNTQAFVEYTDSIKPAAQRYLCFDESGNNYNFEQVITSTAFEIWYHLKEMYGKNYVKVNDLTFGLAQRLTEKYVIKCKDRRKSKEKLYN